MDAARGEDIKFVYVVTTDGKSLYTVGEQVHWKLEAYVQDGRGINPWTSNSSNPKARR